MKTATAPQIDTAQVAKIAHEANRAYCQTIGDHSQPEWDSAPEWQRKSAINEVEFHLNALKNGAHASVSASHDAWLADKERDGWKYGPTKNPETKEHPCFVPYNQLPIEQRLKDYLFSSIVGAFFEAAHHETPDSQQPSTL